MSKGQRHQMSASDRTSISLQRRSSISLGRSSTGKPAGPSKITNGPNLLSPTDLSTVSLQRSTPRQKSERSQLGKGKKGVPATDLSSVSLQTTSSRKNTDSSMLSKGKRSHRERTSANHPRSAEGHEQYTGQGQAMGATTDTSLVSLPRSSAKDSGVKLPIVFCENHKNKELVWYCAGHELMICNSCRTSSHKLCPLTSVIEMVETAEPGKQLTGIEASMADMKTRLDKIRRSREQSLSDINGITKSCETKVRKFKERIVEWAEELEQAMIVDIRRAATARMSAISEQLKGCKQLMEQVEKDTKVTADAKAIRDEARGLVAAHQLSKTVKSVTKAITEIEQEPYNVGMTFKPDRGLLLQLKSGGKIGTLKVDATISETSTNTSKSIRDMAVISSYEVNVSSDWVTGSTFMPDGQLVLTDRRNNKVLLLTKDLDLTSELRMSTKPCNVAVNSFKDVIVTLPDEKKLQYVSVAKSLQSGNSIRTNKPCWGVAVHNGEIYVTVHNNPGDGEVQVLDRVGTIMRRIGVDADGRGLFHSPYYVAIGTRGTVLVHVSDNHGEVACYNRTGDLVFSVNHKEVKGPSGMLVDRAGKLLVCSGEGNSGVHVLKTDGRRDQTFLTSRDGVVKPPLSVAYRNSDDTLVVTMWGRTSIRAYKLK